MHYGVDCSSNNSHPINWAAAFTFLQKIGSGSQPFAIIKISEGTTYGNPFAPGDIAAAHAAGFAVGGYLMDHGNADPAAEEAFYHRLATGIPQFDDDELPEGLSTPEYIAHLKGLIAQDPEAVQYLNQSEVTEGYDYAPGLWLAQYNGAPSVTFVPTIIHQYTSSGVLPGCVGFFDLNAWTGTEAQFQSMFGVAPVPVPPAPTEESIVISSALSINPGQTDVFQISGGVLWHKYRQGANPWGNEAVAGPLPGTRTGVIVTLTGEPKTVMLNGQCVVTAEDTSGRVWFFAQTFGSADWGVNELP